MSKKILLYRTDRIGDFLLTCPTIKTIKEFYPDSDLSIITSEKNYSYIQTFDFFKHVYKFPKKNFFDKIKFFYFLSKKNYDYIFIFDGKDRSILMSCFLQSKNKFAKIVNKNQSYICKLFNIKFAYDIFGKELNELHQNLLDYANINKNISNFDYLTHKKDNNFASKIPFDKFILIHLDEKWFSSTYIKSYKEINPSYEQFSNFIKFLSEKDNIVITTGLITNPIIERLLLDSKNQIDQKIFLFNIKENIIIIDKPTFLDLESLLRKTKVLITCHGALTHAAASFKIKIIDLVEETSDKLVQRYSLYIKNYYKLYRENFKSLTQKLYNKL